MIRNLVPPACLCIALAFCAPARARATQKRTRAGPAAARRKRPYQGPHVDFLDSTRAYWFRRSVNDSIYYQGYSPNAVFLERDQVRALNLDLYKPTTRVTFGRLRTGKMPPPPEYRLVINGRVVEIKD